MRLQLLIFLIILSSLFAGYDVLATQQRLKPISIEEQLSQSVVTAVVEDKQGFLWIGTEDGLNRFDGYKVKIFNKHNSNLSHNSINDLLIDNNGDLWIATENGVNLFQQETGKIINYNHNPIEPFSVADDYVVSLAKDDKGGIWVGTYNGPSYFDPTLQGFKTFPLMINRRINASVKEVRKILVDNQQVVWLITTRGELARFHPTRARFELVKDIETEPLGIVRDISISPQETLWISAADHGIVEYNPKSNSFEPISFKEMGLDLKELHPTDILFDNTSLWIGTVKDGLFSINLSDNSYHQYQYGLPGASNSDRINDLFKDSSGIIWVGTSAYLNKINPNSIIFNHLYYEPEQKISLVDNSSFSLLATNNNYLLVGGEAGGVSTFKYNESQLLAPVEVLIPEELAQESVTSMIEVDYNLIWIVTFTDIWAYDLEQQSIKKITGLNPTKQEFLSALKIGENIWLGTSNGLWQLDKKANVKKYKIIDLDFHRDNRINVIKADGTNGLWVGTESGVFNYEFSRQKFIPLSQIIEDTPDTLQDTVMSLSLDDRNRLWVGTYGNGLVVIDFVEKNSRSFNSTTSGLHNTIYSIEKDRNNFLWLATGKGLFRIDPKDFSVSHFSLSEDQPIIEFNSTSSTIDKYGNLYFGGVNGVVYFKGETYQTDRRAPLPVITEVTVNNDNVVVGEEKYPRLEKPINLAKKVVFYPQDTAISFEFSGLNFIDSRNNRYRYFLQGYDEKWTETDARSRKATYTNLQPDTYTFRVNASNKDGVWSEQEATIEVVVKTGTWQSPLAYAVYGFVLGLIILAFSYLAWTRARERRLAAYQLAQSEERLKLSLWGSGDELWDWQIVSGALHLSNEWQYDFPRDGIRSGYSMANSNIHHNDLPYVRQSLHSHLSGKSRHYESTYRISDENGGWVWVLDRGKVVSRDENNKALRMAGTLKNITELKNTEQQLSMIVKSFDNISDAVWILDEDFTYIAVNKAFTHITGFAEEEVIGKIMKVNAIQQVTDEYFDDLRDNLNSNSRWHGELDAIRKSGQVYPIEINIDVVRDNDGNILNYVGVFSDITFRKKAEKELLRLATVDQLTGLKNRTSFRQQIEKIISKSKKNSQHALLFIDLDNFKRINDSLGHGIGDELLTNVAQILEEIEQKNKGVVARLGGDEFTILLQDVETWNQPAKVAQAILERFSRPLILSTAEVVVSPSIGIVMYPENGDNAEDLLKNADTAMYYAKKKGKNTYQFYTKQMNEQAKMRLTLESELRQAIEKDEFVVFYQPKISLQTGDITGLEALIRWRNPNRGLVLPNEFIPLAEEVGFIIPISQKVIEKTCLQIRDWQNRGLFKGKVAVNLSAIQFYHENLWETVKNALHIAKIKADSLEFEITEGMVMEDLSHSIQQMRTLQEMGISLALDDFGVGYSSLGNLKDFPINTLKIDRSFVWDLEESERDRNLVSSIITLAHNLDIKVVAEGVENAYQASLLKEMGCEEIQGFLFSKPVPPWEIESMLLNPKVDLKDLFEDID